MDILTPELLAEEYDERDRLVMEALADLRDRIKIYRDLIARVAVEEAEAYIRAQRAYKTDALARAYAKKATAEAKAELEEAKLLRSYASQAVEVHRTRLMVTQSKSRAMEAAVNLAR